MTVIYQFPGSRIAASDHGIGSTELLRRAGITYRQLDYWCRTDLLKPQHHGHSGTDRSFPITEVSVACLMGQLITAGINIRQAHDMARELTNTGTTTIAGITIHLPVEP